MLRDGGETPVGSDTRTRHRGEEALETNRTEVINRANTRDLAPRTLSRIELRDGDRRDEVGDVERKVGGRERLGKLSRRDPVAMQGLLEETVSRLNLLAGNLEVRGLQTTIKGKVILDLSHHRAPILIGVKPRVLS